MEPVIELAQADHKLRKALNVELERSTNAEAQVRKLQRECEAQAQQIADQNLELLAVYRALNGGDPERFLLRETVQELGERRRQRERTEQPTTAVDRAPKNSNEWEPLPSFPPPPHPPTADVVRCQECVHYPLVPGYVVRCMPGRTLTTARENLPVECGSYQRSTAARGTDPCSCSQCQQYRQRCTEARIAFRPEREE